MKTIFKYILMVATTMIVVACQDGLDQISTEKGMGNVQLSISTNEHTRGGDFSPEELRVRIYDEDDRLVRVYTEGDEIPEKIALVAGNYTFKVEGRDKAHTTKFKGSDVEDDRTKIYYIGEEEVTVAAGGTVSATVECDPRHVRVGIVLDEDEAENKYLSEVGISLAAMSLTTGNNPVEVDDKQKADFDAAIAASTGVDRLDFGTAVSGSTTSFEGEDYAYFLLPEDSDGDPTVNTIAWAITGKHSIPAEDQTATAAESDATTSDGDSSNTATEENVTKFDRAGQIVVEPGKAYELQFRYSKLPDGSVTITVNVNYEVDDWDDQITFKPEPEIKPTSANIWTEDADNNVYVVGTSDISFEVTSINKLDGFGLNDTKLWDNGNYATGADELITVTPNGADYKNFTVTVKQKFFETLAGGEQNFKLSVYDGTTEVGKFKTSFQNQGLTAPTDINLWLNTAKFNAVVTNESATSVVVKFRKVKGENSYGDWVEVNLTENTTGGNVYGGTSVASWSEGTNVNSKTIFTPDSDKSIFANGTYEYQLVVDGSDYGPSGTFTTTVEQPIQNADFESSSLSCWGQSNSNAPFWGSGNNWAKTNLCTQGSKDGNGGSKAAVLTSSASVGVLASGNLFTGTFTMNGMAGTVGFGQPYTWQARPTALRVKYHATVGKADIALYKDETGNFPLKEGDQDVARIYALIVDWSARPGVTSGTSAPTGCFEPTAITSLAGSGAIIGYASLLIDKSTDGDSMVTVDIPFEFYDKVTNPSNPSDPSKNPAKYSIVISAACSAYGDYMCGCSKNVMYIDDFQWVY